MHSQLNELRDQIFACQLNATEDVIERHINRTQSLDQGIGGSRVQPIAQQFSESWIEKIRRDRKATGTFEAFIREYSLSSEEGIALMTLAESLIRTPDRRTAKQLIADKLKNGNWAQHLGHSESMLVNASTFGLLFAGEIVEDQYSDVSRQKHWYEKLFKRLGETLANKALGRAMNMMADHFVMARNIKEALGKVNPSSARESFSFDMLGEAARTRQDALDNKQAYEAALDTLVSKAKKILTDELPPSLSVKLSALSPRYEYTHRAKALEDIMPWMLNLLDRAVDNGIQITLDAEDIHLLPMYLDIYQSCVEHLVDKEGDHVHVGFVLQAYQKNALEILDWLLALGQHTGLKIPVRLVKGAYWDMEIKRAQQLNLTHYPVFSEKFLTDINYESCALKLLQNIDAFIPQFATHNARTAAYITALCDTTALNIPPQKYEFQRLYGMGKALFECIREESPEARTRIYAPIGEHRALLPYLLRRLIENGANNGFINAVYDSSQDLALLGADPHIFIPDRKNKAETAKIENLASPGELYAGDQYSRRRARGWDLQNPLHLAELHQRMKEADDESFRQFFSCIEEDGGDQVVHVTSPAQLDDALGAYQQDSASKADTKAVNASRAFGQWSKTDVETRAELLEKIGDSLEQQAGKICYLLCHEAGRTLQDAVDELREAVDFCFYYAALAREKFRPQSLTSPTGETNSLLYDARGVFLCISPWNFPLAIFAGQSLAALVSGNCVLAKPARQTTLVAEYVTNLMYEAGLPSDVFQLILAEGEEVSNMIPAIPHLGGLAFTGSHDTAKAIQMKLMEREGALVPLIAETGGQNVMIVDSSALLEQVVDDIIASTFRSAGQRCSSVRTVYVQEELRDRFVDMISGAVNELVIDRPWYSDTDMGPIIDEQARDRLERHCETMEQQAKCLFSYAEEKLPSDGYYFAPKIYEIESLEQLKQEVFGPVLHVIFWKSQNLNEVVEQINATGYGLTFGVHTRIQSTAAYLCKAIHAGNCYVNRDTIGAVVGTTPFGGQGLSGTGPKAGGPNALNHYVSEKTVTINTAAVGGNISLYQRGKLKERASK